MTSYLTDITLNNINLAPQEEEVLRQALAKYSQYLAGIINEDYFNQQAKTERVIVDDLFTIINRGVAS